MLLAVPNLLTLARAPLAVALWIEPGSPAAMLSLMAAAALSDGLDGWLARRIRARARRRGMPEQQLLRASRLGGWLDPVCDKLFIASLMGAAYVAYGPPFFVVVLIATRELIQLPLMSVYVLTRAMGRAHRYEFQAGVFGKAATVCQFLAIVVIILQPTWAVPSAVVAATVGLVAMLVYIHRGIHTLDADGGSSRPPAGEPP